MASREGDRPREIELRLYGRVLRRRLLVIMLVTVAAAATGWIWASRQEHVYRATAVILLRLQGTDVDGRGRYEPHEIDTGLFREVQVMESDAVLDAVSDTYGSEVTAEDVGARIAGNGQPLIRVSAVRPDPDDAADLATVFARVYVVARRTQFVRDRGDADAVPGGREPQTPVDEFSDVLSPIDGISLHRVAPVPSDAVSPLPVRDATAAGALGLIAGVGLAFLLEHRSTRRARGVGPRRARRRAARSTWPGTHWS